MSFRTAIVSSLLLMTLATQLNLGQVGAQETQIAKKKFTVIGYYTAPTRCHPVMVTSVSIGANPAEVLTSQAGIESFSAKPITAVKLKWEIYRMDVAMKKRRAGCEGTGEPAEVFLSGETPLIPVGRLAEKEICNIISPYPSITPPKVTRTVMVERAIIMWDEVKSLTTDGTRNTFKDNYAALVFVSEVHFEDGTTWTGEIK
jgi:hypothetical protein